MLPLVPWIATKLPHIVVPRGGQDVPIQYADLVRYILNADMNSKPQNTHADATAPGILVTSDGSGCMDKVSLELGGTKKGGLPKTTSTTGSCQCD